VASAGLALAPRQSIFSPNTLVDASPPLACKPNPGARVERLDGAGRHDANGELDALICAGERRVCVAQIAAPFIADYLLRRGHLFDPGARTVTVFRELLRTQVWVATEICERASPELAKQLGAVDGASIMTKEAAKRVFYASVIGDRPLLAWVRMLLRGTGMVTSAQLGISRLCAANLLPDGIIPLVETLITWRGHGVLHLDDDDAYYAKDCIGRYYLYRPLYKAVCISVVKAKQWCDTRANLVTEMLRHCLSPHELLGIVRAFCPHPPVTPSMLATAIRNSKPDGSTHPT
jgi:hypothetical protein